MNQNQQNQNPTPENQQLEILNKAVSDAQTALRFTDKRLIKNYKQGTKNKINVPAGVQYDWLNNTSFNNVVYPRDKIPDNILRMVEKRNGVVAAAITLRIQQALEFSHVSHDKDVPGWEVVLKDDKKTPSSAQKKQKEFLEDFIINGKADGFTPIQSGHDDLRHMLVKYVRDRLLIDKVTWEIERNKKGEALALWVLDGATILPVLPGGFYGSTSQVGFGIAHGYNKLSDEIRKAKLAKVPPVESIAYIQELLYGTSGGGITAAFTEDDLIYDLSNELSDIRYYKQGLSCTERANTVITAFINSVNFNSNGLSRGSIPKVAIAMGKDSGFTEEQIEDMQDEWMANFEATDGQWNIPILNSDAKILPMLQSNRDMEYQKYMEFVGALTCSIFGIDSTELGLRFNQAQSVLSENNDAKQLFSKNRGVRELLGSFTYTVNNFIKKSGYEFAKDFKFRFNGLSTEDKNFEADLRAKNVKVFKTVNEIRKDNDMPPIEGGDIILDPTFLQNKQADAMANQEGGGDEESGFGGFSDEESDQMVDEVMDDMNKGVMLI